jgi:tight adherence protein C
MSRLVIASALSLWFGVTILFSLTRWGKHISLAERLRPHAVGSSRRSAAGLMSAQSARDSLGPLAGAIGAKLAAAFGVQEELSVRLRRVHATIDASGFRLRQLGVATASLGATLAIALVFPLSPILVALMLVGAPLLAFLVIEQQLAAQSQAWKRRLFLEAPVIAEQIAMYLSAGNSLGASLARAAQRGSGAIATDLQDVMLRVRQGLTEREALTEWAQIAQVPAINQLVAVLGLVGEASDLGRIVSDEARSLRREVHRELISTIESRNQQVWIPVTVAALVPGVIVLSVPFMAALQNFA